MNTPWKTPVVIMIGEPAAETVIATTQTAAWAMIEDWPDEDGEMLDRALLIIADVDKGRRKPEDARQAFVKAAQEAGILVRA